MDVDRYLRRIGLGARPSADAAALARLQESHLEHVPFENLDIVWGVPIELDLERLYAKVVERRRGGFCYELNGLFGWLLGALGFAVRRVSARVFDSRSGRLGPEFDHLALLVDVGTTHLVDVGYGDGPRRPLVLPRDEREDAGGRWRVRPDPGRAAAFALERYRAGTWSLDYRFTTHARRLEEFAAMCRYHQTSRESIFTRGVLCTQARRDGRVTVRGDVYTRRRAGHKRRRTVDPAAVERLLEHHFGVRRQES